MHITHVHSVGDDKTVFKCASTPKGRELSFYISFLLMQGHKQGMRLSFPKGWLSFMSTRKGGMPDVCT